MADLTLRTLTADDGLRDVLGDIARLRIAVFREWPYLYDGDLDYEAGYLAKFAASPGAMAAVAVAPGGETVGASTAMPLAHEHDGFSAPFPDHGYPIEQVFYCAETVLLPEWRGQGLYRHFFAAREDHARRLNATGAYDFRWVAFCGVVRPDDHPLKPAGAAPLDPIWRRFGYAPVPGLVAHFAWKDLDEDAETEKPLQFWIKPLSPAGTTDIGK